MRVDVFAQDLLESQQLKTLQIKDLRSLHLNDVMGLGGIGDLMIHQDIQVSLRLHISLAQNIHLFMKTIRFQNLHQTTPHTKNYLNILMVMQIILKLKKILNLELK